MNESLKPPTLPKRKKLRDVLKGLSDAETERLFGVVGVDMILAVGTGITGYIFLAKALFNGNSEDFYNGAAFITASNALSETAGRIARKRGVLPPETITPLEEFVEFFKGKNSK